MTVYYFRVSTRALNINTSYSTINDISTERWINRINYITNLTRLVPRPRPVMLPDRKAPAAELMIRSDPSITSPAAAVAAAYHELRAMPLDMLPGRNTIVIRYCCGQPTITPRLFLPLLAAAGSTRLVCRATLPYPGRVHTAGGRAMSRGMCI